MKNADFFIFSQQSLHPALLLLLNANLQLCRFDLVLHIHMYIIVLQSLMLSVKPACTIMDTLEPIKSVQIIKAS